MPWSESLPQFSLAGTLLTVLLLFFAAFGEPLLGRRAFTWLSRRGDGDARALGLLYAVTMAIHALWGLLVLVVLLLSPNLNLVDLGLRTPDAFAPIVGGAIGGTIALAAFWVLVNGLPTRERLPILARLPQRGAGRAAEPEDEDESEDGSGRRRGGRGSGHRGRRGADKPMTLPEPGRQQYLLLPRTRRERGLAAGMAVTGGVFGELLYRGLFITLVASMGVPLWGAAVLSILLFALAHAYQGWWGLLSAGFSGTLFTVLFLGTGSLVVPVLVHVALNLRSVVFPPAAERQAAEDAYYSGDDYYDDEYGYEDDEYGHTGEFEAVEAEERAASRAGGGNETGDGDVPEPPAEGGAPPAHEPRDATRAMPAQGTRWEEPLYPDTREPGPRYQGPQQPGPQHAGTQWQGPPPVQGQQEPQWTDPRQRGPLPGGTPPFGAPAPNPYPPNPQGPPTAQGPFPGPGPSPQGPPPGQFPQGPPPQGPQGPGAHQGYGPQGPRPAGYPDPPVPPAHDPGDFLSGPAPSGAQPGHAGAWGGGPDGRNLYPDEWIDRYHGPEDDTPGPGSPYRD